MFIKKLSRLICLTLLISFASQQKASAITQQQATAAISIIAGCAVAGYTFIKHTTHDIDELMHRHGEMIKTFHTTEQEKYELRIKRYKNLALGLAYGIVSGVLAYKGIQVATPYLANLYNRTNPEVKPEHIEECSYEFSIQDKKDGKYRTVIPSETFIEKNKGCDQNPSHLMDKLQEQYPSACKGEIKISSEITSKSPKTSYHNMTRYNLARTFPNCITAADKVKIGPQIPNYDYQFNGLKLLAGSPKK